MFNLCLKYTLQTEDAQDMAQEVFVKVYRQLAAFDPAKASLKTWIYRITVNHCLDFIRGKRAKKRLSFITSWFEAPKHDPPDPHHPILQIEHKESQLRLMQWIHELPGQQQTALILSKLEGHTQRQVAEIMQTTEKAVESLVQRAKKNLEKKWNGAEGS